MERCRSCGKRIENLDFYISSTKGPICSSCLVHGDPPPREVKALFGKRPARPETDEQQEMTLDDLENAVRCF